MRQEGVVVIVGEVVSVAGAAAHSRLPVGHDRIE